MLKMNRKQILKCEAKFVENPRTKVKRSTVCIKEENKQKDAICKKWHVLESKARTAQSAKEYEFHSIEYGF